MAIPNEPLTRAEQYLNRIATGEGTIPDEPLTRVEMYLDEIAENGGGGDPEAIVSAVTDWLDENVDPVGSAVVVDSSLTIEGAAADAKATGDAIRTSGGGLTDDVKQALLDCFENVAWINEDGQDYYDALEAALYPPANLVSISAVFNQGSAVIYNTDSLDTLKQYLVVTAQYTDQTSETLEDTDYTLSGTLTEGTSVITVSYGGKTTTFNVTVTERGSIPSDYQKVEYIESDGSQFINTGITPNDNYLKIDIIYHKTQVSTEQMIVGSIAAGSGSAPFGIGFTSTTNRIYAYSSTSAEVISPLTYADKVNAIAVFQSNSPTAKITISANGQSASGEKTGANSSYLPNGVFCVFSAGGLYKASGRVYSLVASNSSGEILNLVPCYRKSDGVIGMYDTVSSTFFTNSGSGTFTKGSDI